MENGFGLGVLSTTVWKGLVAVAKAENRATLVLLEEGQSEMTVQR